MTRRNWTLVLVPHDNQNSRSIQLSARGLRAGTSLLVLFVAAFAVVTIGFFLKDTDVVRAQLLERENRLLAAEVSEMRQQVEALNASIEHLSEKDEKYRAIAGLEPLDDDVRRVGIGGPGTATLESAELYKLNPPVGEQVFSNSYDLETLVRKANLLRLSMDEALETLQDHTERLEATPSIAPSEGHLSSLFSSRRKHPVLRITRPHKGIDIAAPVGEPILAPAAGTIRFAGTRAGGYGKVVEIDHGYGYKTRFAHASKILVRRGQQVERGELIAEVGATGLVSGPHLHYEVMVNGRQVDPQNFIITDAIPD